jgi:hypothetical protein
MRTRGNAGSRVPRCLLWVHTLSLEGLVCPVLQTRLTTRSHSPSAHTIHTTLTLLLGAASAQECLRLCEKLVADIKKEVAEAGLPGPPTDRPLTIQDEVTQSPSGT